MSIRIWYWTIYSVILTCIVCPSTNTLGFIITLLTTFYVHARYLMEFSSWLLEHPFFVLVFLLWFIFVNVLHWLFCLHQLHLEPFRACFPLPFPATVPSTLSWPYVLQPETPSLWSLNTLFPPYLCTWSPLLCCEVWQYCTADCPSCVPQSACSFKTFNTCNAQAL